MKAVFVSDDATTGRKPLHIYTTISEDGDEVYVRVSDGEGDVPFLRIDSDFILHLMPSYALSRVVDNLKDVGNSAVVPYVADPVGALLNPDDDQKGDK
jgi:hypothetical protein